MLVQIQEAEGKKRFLAGSKDKGDLHWAELNEPPGEYTDKFAFNWIAQRTKDFRTIYVSG